MICWCLYLHHRSSGAYSTLSNYGIMVLLSERTLCDYRHHAPSGCGFSKATDVQLLEMLEHTKPTHLAKYITIIMNEMYIEEGLVFQRSSNALIGYQDLGDVNNLLHDAEDQIYNPGNHRRILAKLMLVFMVRGVYTPLKFPYAQFPTASTKGANLFSLLHKVQSGLTWLGFCIMAVSCDGASDNRRMFPFMIVAVYKTANAYAKSGDIIFSYLIPPRLIKTIRNCFQRENRG